MAITEAATQALVQQLIDDAAGALWSASNLTALIAGVVDELYTELLESFPYVNSTEAAATIVSPGYFNTASLTRFYRLQDVSRDGQSFFPADPRDVLLANDEAIAAPSGSYVTLGSKVYLFPLDTTASVRIRYSTLPTAFSNAGTALDWPDGSYMAVVYAAAARAMERGDREQSDRFEKRAEAAMMKVKARLRKNHVGPIVPWLNTSPEEFGGE